MVHKEEPDESRLLQVIDGRFLHDQVAENSELDSDGKKKNKDLTQSSSPY